MRRPSLAAALLLILFAYGCGGGPASDSAGEDGVAADSGARKFLSVGTAPPGGAFFIVGGALAEVLDENQGDNQWQVTAEATKGSQENIRRLASGELDLALANAAISYFASRGEGGWDKAYEIRSVMTLAPNVALFVTPQGSDVQQVTDLRGKRVVLGPAGAGFHYFLRPILKAHGVEWEELNELNGTQSAAVEMLSDGSAAAAFLGGAVPTASITQAASSHALHFIPYTDEAKGSLVADFSFFRPATIPAGTYRGQDVEYAGLDVGSMQLVTSAKVDEELIYRITKTIYENREKVVEKHAAGRAIKAGNVVRDTGIAFHPGAVRYYKEAGIWPADETAP